MSHVAGPYRGGGAARCATCRAPVEEPTPVPAAPPDYWQFGIDGRPLAGQHLDPPWLARWYPVAECRGCGHVAPDLSFSYEGLGGMAEIRASLARSPHHEVARRFLAVAHLFSADDPRATAIWVLRAAWTDEAAGLVEVARNLRVRAADEIERALSYGLVLTPRAGATSAVLAEVLRLAGMHERAGGACLRGVYARPGDLEHALLFATSRAVLDRSTVPITRGGASASLRERNPLSIAAELGRILERLPTPPAIRLVTPGAGVVPPTEEEAVTFACEHASEGLVWDLLRARRAGVWEMITIHRDLRRSLVRALAHGDRPIVEQALAVLFERGISAAATAESITEAIAEALELEPRSAAALGRLSNDRDPVVAKRAGAIMRAFARGQRAREQAALAAIDDALDVGPRVPVREPSTDVPTPAATPPPRDAQPVPRIATAPPAPRVEERALLVRCITAWRTRREPDVEALGLLARLYLEEDRRVEAILAHEALVRVRPADEAARDTLRLLWRFSSPPLEPQELEPEELREYRREEYESDPVVLGKLGPFTGTFARFEARDGERALRRALERLADCKMPLHGERMTRELARSSSASPQASVAIYELCAAAGETLALGAELEAARDVFLRAAPDVAEEAKLPGTAPADEQRAAAEAFVGAHRAHGTRADATRTALLRFARACRASGQRAEALLAYEAALRLWGERMEVNASIGELRKLAAASRDATEPRSDDDKAVTAALLESFERLTEHAGEPTLRRALERFAAEGRWTVGTKLAAAFARAARRTDAPTATALDLLVMAVSPP